MYGYFYSGGLVIKRGVQHSSFLIRYRVKKNGGGLKIKAMRKNMFGVNKYEWWMKFSFAQMAFVVYFF